MPVCQVAIELDREGRHDFGGLVAGQVVVRAQRPLTMHAVSVCLRGVDVPVAPEWSCLYEGQLPAGEHRYPFSLRACVADGDAFVPPNAACIVNAEADWVNGLSAHAHEQLIFGPPPDLQAGVQLGKTTVHVVHQAVIWRRRVVAQGRAVIGVAAELHERHIEVEVLSDDPAHVRTVAELSTVGVQGMAEAPEPMLVRKRREATELSAPVSRRQLDHGPYRSALNPEKSSVRAGGGVCRAPASSTASNKFLFPVPAFAPYLVEGPKIYSIYWHLCVKLLDKRGRLVEQQDAELLLGGQSTLPTNFTHRAA